MIKIAVTRTDEVFGTRKAITIRYHQARTLDEKNTALQDLLGHADTHSRLIDEVIKYQADHGNFAKPPAIAAVTGDDKPPATPTKRRSSRTREPAVTRPRPGWFKTALHNQDGPADAGPRARPSRTVRHLQGQAVNPYAEVARPLLFARRREVRVCVLGGSQLIDR
jgi:hypothetical protein